ncbi:hypothetical protein ACS0TY_023158 [Phlomoides rotata]
MVDEEPIQRDQQERVVEKKNPEKISEEKDEQEMNIPIPLHDKGKQVAHVPYPQRLKKKGLDVKFTKFFEIFKWIHINIPFANTPLC